MKSISKMFETIFTAVAFAECGEHETARLLMKEGEPFGKKRKKHHSKGSTDEVPAARAVG